MRNFVIFPNEHGEGFGDKGDRTNKGGARRGSKPKGWEAGWRLQVHSRASITDVTGGKQP